MPFLRALGRLPVHVPRTITAPLGRRIASAVNRHQFYTVRLRDGVAFPAFKGSGDITSLSQADGYIEIPADQSVVEEGAAVSGDTLLNYRRPIRRSYSISSTSAVCRSKATALCSNAPRNSQWQR